MDEILAKRYADAFMKYAEDSIGLEKALDDSARQFAKTGTIWEFYHPSGGNPEVVQRKPKTKRNMPCTDYLGHNPLIAMAVMYDNIK